MGVVEQVEEQLVRLLDHLGDPRVRAVDLVDDEDDRAASAASALRSTKRVCGQRALGRVDQQHDAVDHRQAALDLATEVGVPGVSMMLIVIGLGRAAGPA